MTRTAPAARPSPLPDMTNAVELHGPLDPWLIAMLTRARTGQSRRR